MTNVITIHPKNPQQRLLKQVVQVLQDGGVVVYPGDTGYAIGCCVGHKRALERIRQLRQLPKDHNFTLICQGLSQIAEFARVDNPTYRLLRAHTPGAYTFILPATKDVPKLLLHAKKKTIGIRVSAYPIILALLDLLQSPMLTVSLIMPQPDFVEDTFDEPMDIAPQNIDEVEEMLEGRVDMIVDAGYCGLHPSSIIDLTGDTPQVIRIGAGDVEPFEWS